MGRVGGRGSPLSHPINAPVLTIRDRTRHPTVLGSWMDPVRLLWRPVAAMVLLLWISRLGLAAWRPGNGSV